MIYPPHFGEHHSQTQCVADREEPHLNLQEIMREQIGGRSERE